MAQAVQKYKPMHPVMRSMQKRDARKMLASPKPPPEVRQEDLDQEKKLQAMKQSINKIIENPQLTPEQKKAIAAGTAKAWYADLPGAPADIVGMGLDYLAEGLRVLLPSKEQAGFDVAKRLGITSFQEGVRDPIGGYKHLEKVGEEVGYIPPATGMPEEMYARLAMGFVTPVPVPMTAGVFASNRARTLPKLSLAKAKKMETESRKPQIATRQEIFEETGFFLGPEGEWRFEIPDKDMKINQEFLKTKTDLWGKDVASGPGYELDIGFAPLSEVVDHPELFKAYPELKEVYVKFEPPGSDRRVSGLKGYYSPEGEYVPIAAGSGPPLTKGDVPTDLFGEPLQSLEFSSKTPEAHRKVIAVVAPTRQREIKRLNMIIEKERGDIEFSVNKIDEIKKDPKLATEAEGWKGGPPEADDLIKSEEFNITRSQDTIKVNLKELQRLEAGGQPDMQFSVKSTLTHEIQHAIQDIENLPRGGAPETAFKETKEAALAPILEKATKGGKHSEFGIKTHLDQERRLFDEKMQDMAMMDDVRYLQQLQKFIESEQPTRNARFIENSSFNYGLTIAEETMLGARPKKHRRQEYAEYLRRKAQLYQKKVVDKYLPGAAGVYSQKRDKFNKLLGELFEYTEKKGTGTRHSKQIGEQFRLEITGDGIKRTSTDSMFDPQTVRGEGTEMGTKGLYDQPDWLSLGEKNVKNYVKRLARAGDKHREGAGLKRQLETKLADLEQMRKDFDSKGRGSDFEFYKRLAGEAEARAVQKRLELADEGEFRDFEDLPTHDQDWIDNELVRIQEERGKVPTDLYDVPIRELAFTGRTPAAKTQAKTNARKMLAQ